MDDEKFDTDLDDDDDEIDRKKKETLPKLSFEEKLTVHRTNRLTETFRRVDLRDSVKNNIECLPPLRCQTPSNAVERIRRYEKNCHLLDTTIDWQLRAVLSYDKITILNRSFSFNDIQAFTSAIEPNLQSLTLNSIGLSSRSLDLLCQGLKKSPHLHLLNLSYNKIDQNNFEKLVQTIKGLPSLLYLSLIECGIRDSYGRRIGDLCRHKRMKELNLNGNEFEEMACIFIGNRLTENNSLVSLNLSWNRIRSYATIALFRGFEVNKTLTEFDISWSDLGYDGSVALRRVLTVNKTLQNLNISNCNIDWTCAKLISEGLVKNSTLKILNLSFNPLTTHGVHHIVQALTIKRNAITVLDLSGLIVFSATVRLAEKIAQRRHFVMKYDLEMPVHDYLGREQITKADSMRKIIQHLDGRNWRPLDYFRMLESKRKLQGQNEPISQHSSKFNADYGANTIENLQQHLLGRFVQPFTYKNLTTVIQLQRMRDRWRKARINKQEKDLEERNQKILETVNQHFPNIDIISKQEKHKHAIEQLAKPRIYHDDQ